MSAEELAETVIVFVFAQDGNIFKFKLDIRTNKSQLLETFHLIKMLERDDNWAGMKKKETLGGDT